MVDRDVSNQWKICEKLNPDFLALFIMAMKILTLIFGQPSFGLHQQALVFELTRLINDLPKLISRRLLQKGVLIFLNFLPAQNQQRLSHQY